MQGFPSEETDKTPSGLCTTSLHKEYHFPYHNCMIKTHRLRDEQQQGLEYLCLGVLGLHLKQTKHNINMKMTSVKHIAQVFIFYMVVYRSFNIIVVVLKPKYDLFLLLINWHCQ